MNSTPTPPVWSYRPDAHKTAHHGRVRVIHFGPHAQEVLTGHIPEDPEAPVFGRRQSHAYALAIRRACRRAGFPIWSPNQLRHAAATRIRAAVGLEAAWVVLGHAHARMTEIYAEPDIIYARSVIERLG